MNTVNRLNLIPSYKINPQLWDACVQQHQAPIYLKFNYLNSMSANWVGLVLENYKGIMPICFKQKFGIKFSYTPAFIQQLGWVGEPIEFEILEDRIYDFLKYGDIMFNHQHDFKQLHFVAKTNLIIPLNTSYDNIYNNYSSDLKQNLKKAAKENLVYQASNEIPQAISLYKSFYADRLAKTTQQDFDHFLNLCLQLNETDNCLVRKVVNHNKELLSIALLLKDENRMYNIANSTTLLGRKTASNHFLIDSILKEFANSNLIFDFEGSDLPGVQSFYENFGALNQPYFHWHFNKLWFLPKNF
jgi:hypothetical protein